MTTDGVVKAAGFRRMNEESRWNVDNWNALRGLPWDVTEPGAEATEVSLTTSNHPSAFDATSALSHKDRVEEIRCDELLLCVVHGKTAKLHTEECRTRIGEQMEHDLKGLGRLQVHETQRDVEPEVGVDQAPARQKK